MVRFVFALGYGIATMISAFAGGYHPPTLPTRGSSSQCPPTLGATKGLVDDFFWLWWRF